MAKIRISGDTSGYVELAAPAVAGSSTFTLPTGTVDYAADVASKADKDAGYQYNQTVYFTSSGTFAKADYPWLRAIRVRLVGGGGGGGGCSTTGAGQNAIGGSGGGGGYAESFITDIAGLSSSVTVTVGTGGSGGAAGTNNGSTGNASSFGTAVAANGGSGGGGAAAFAPPQFVAGGVGGTATAGDLQIAGHSAVHSNYLNTGAACPGPAGGTLLGGSQSSNFTTTGAAGLTGRNYGGGGTGGVNVQNQGTARAGGAGAPGIVIVELYA